MLQEYAGEAKAETSLFVEIAPRFLGGSFESEEVHRCDCGVLGQTACQSRNHCGT